MTARRTYLACMASYFLGAAAHAMSVERAARKRAKETV